MQSFTSLSLFAYYIEVILIARQDTPTTKGTRSNLQLGGEMRCEVIPGERSDFEWRWSTQVTPCTPWKTYHLKWEPKAQRVVKNAVSFATGIIWSSHTTYSLPFPGVYLKDEATLVAVSAPFTGWTPWTGLRENEWCNDSKQQLQRSLRNMSLCPKTMAEPGVNLKNIYFTRGQ